MIRINQIKIPVFEAANGEEGLLRKKTAKLLRVREDGIRKLRIVRRSVDAREKNNICYVYLLDVRLSDSVIGPGRKTEEAFVRKLKNANVTIEELIPWKPEPASAAALRQAEEDGQPVIVGSGPCGLFAAHTLCRAGLRPLILERGQCVEKRRETVDRFFETGKLDPDSNVQFGEGGAGTFSDGKLNTSVKGQGSLIRYVLETFADCGADREILIDQKPHIGTDVLSEVIRNMREEIIAMGGRFLFETKLCGIETEDGALSAIRIELPKGHEARKHAERVLAERSLSGPEIPCRRLILATGHSARDTVSMLYESGVEMEAKPFAMGLRVQHPQALVNRALYGTDRLSEKEALLGPSPYKLTHRCKNGRSVYSFCMCPGGYVVNSSSEEGRLCVNGMSYHDRNGENANAALIVNVTPADFPSEHPLSGIAMQRALEEKAYALCGGAVPMETYGDFKAGKTEQFRSSAFSPAFCGYAALADLRFMLPDYMQEALLEGMEAFDRVIPGFASEDAIFAGIESRTSSPVRIPRGKTMEANIRGIFPAGEGAGYAGGITSAAVDGIRAAMAVCGMQAGKKDTGESV